MGISLVTFEDATVTAQDDAILYNAFLPKSGIIYGATVTISSSTTLHIAAGHGVIAGRKFTIDATDITVGLAPSGSILGRLYIHLDLSNADNPIEFKTETGNSLTDPIQNSNVNLNNGIWEFNIATFTVSTTTIGSLVSVAPTFSAQTQTLTAGQTQVTFDVPTYGNNVITFYTSNGIPYIGLDDSVSGQVTLTFDVQTQNITIYMDIREV